MIKYATRLPPGKPLKELDNFTIRKTVRNCPKGQLLFMNKFLSNIIKSPNDFTVPVLNYKILERNDKTKTYSYFYDMPKLGILSERERHLINCFGFLTRNELSLKEEFPKLHLFLHKIKNKYYDLHSGNILLDEEFNYRLIDLEGFIPTDW